MANNSRLMANFSSWRHRLQLHVTLPCLERQLHETLPIGPEERQSFYIQKQVEQGMKPPPY
jgi:hypothetical protein